MNQFKLYTYDLWGNDEDGYDVNDYYPQETMEISNIEELSDKQIIALIDFTNPEDIEVTSQSDNEIIYFETIKTNKPVCELRLINEESN